MGTMFGLLESMESAAGLVGPALGGLLYQRHTQLPLTVVVALYACVFALVLTFFRLVH